MKRLFCAYVAAVMVLAFFGCTPVTNPDSHAQYPGALVTRQPDNRRDRPGTLYLGARDSGMTITAIQISGNKAGSVEFNAREPAFSGIRSVFEINEQIEVVLSCKDSAPGTKRTLCLCQHRGIEEYKERKPEEYSIWHTEVEIENGFDEVFTMPGDCGPGYYDLLIVGADDISAYTVIKVYNEGELSSKTDAELEALMEEIAG